MLHRTYFTIHRIFKKLYAFLNYYYFTIHRIFKKLYAFLNYLQKQLQVIFHDVNYIETVQLENLLFSCTSDQSAKVSVTSLT